jgi:predicted ATPase
VAFSKEVRKLQSKWDQGAGWPKRLESIDIENIRGWTQQRFELRFPIMALVGENGAGKSTILQCAASVYRPSRETSRERYASDFFTDTPWEKVSGADIGYTVREGDKTTSSSVRKPTSRWRGNNSRPQREVSYVDLSRVQPVSARVGYARLANPSFTETDAEPFEVGQVSRMSCILGRPYGDVRMSLLDADENRKVPVLHFQGKTYSGFHQGAGETTIAELLEADLPKYGLILIDEIESSLHPRAQRNLIRDLAARCRVLEAQIILTTHSPYVLEELPLQARAYIVQSPSGPRNIIYGVSPEFAMSKMDDGPHHEAELYVEDERAKAMLTEIIATAAPELISRVRVIPYGAASVGQALGCMVTEGRFIRPTSVYLDGDQHPAEGCTLLPGGDAPERVVFEALSEVNWSRLAERLGRKHPDVADACLSAMTDGDHHQWARNVAVRLALDSGSLWHAMCSEWASTYLDRSEAEAIADHVRDIIEGITGTDPGPKTAVIRPAAIPVSPPPQSDPIDREQPALQFPDADPD